MKKYFSIIMAVLLVSFLATSFKSPEMKFFDKDVGYSLTIDQNTPAIAVLAYQPVSILIERGVSVPYRGYSKDIITFSDGLSLECNIYYTIQNRELKSPTLIGFESQPDKYPFACNLGLRSASYEATIDSTFFLSMKDPCRNSYTRDVGGLIIEYVSPRAG